LQEIKCEEKSSPHNRIILSKQIRILRIHEG
jgi:hypothetical protein